MTCLGVHPTALVGAGVELGERVTIGPFAVVVGPCRIGDGVWIGPHSVLGTPAELGRMVPDEAGSRGLEIEAGTVIREHVTVHSGAHGPTGIGRSCLVQSHAYVAHDVLVADGCTVAPGARIAGHSWVGQGANIGLGAALRQWSVVGAYAMVGMQAAVARPLPPFSLALGVPARVVGVNRVGLERLGIDATTITRWHEAMLAGEVVGEDGPPELAVHPSRFRDRLLEVGGE